MLLPYETVFSRTRGRVNDPKELSLSENDLLEMYTERLHNVIGNSRVRRLFSSIVFDDEIQQINFTLNNSVDEASDIDFVTDIFVLGMTIEWLEPQVNSILSVSDYLGTDKEKLLKSSYKTNMDRLDSLKTELNKKIRDYGYMYNSYINSES